MSAKGIVYQDLVDDPTDPALRERERRDTVHDASVTNSVANPHAAPTELPTGTEYVGKATTILDTPTESHALAMQAAKDPLPGEHGAATVQHGQEVVDLGWNEPKEQVSSPLVGGMSNEDLWLLVRRFNKVSISRTDSTSLCSRITANVSCERDTICSTGGAGYEYCRRRRIFS